MTPNYGPFLIDLAGPELASHEIEWLESPVVCGVIFFSRNYLNPRQFQSLVSDIRRIRPNALLTVDQEGGRVQRFREGMTRLPAPGILHRKFLHAPELAEEAARAMGWLMAHEITELGVDLSYAPVMDLDLGRNQVIGNRSFGGEIGTVSELGCAWMKGMQDAGMARVIKHFPGHGWANADTHHHMAIDERPFSALEHDMAPFRAAITAGAEAVMPAHVVYPAVDSQPASRSRIWLQDILRGQLGFTGAIISDDLSMKGATELPLAPRLRQSLEAGCDILLLCNEPDATEAAIRYLETLDPDILYPAASVARRHGLRLRKQDDTDRAFLQQARLLAAELIQFAETSVA